MDAHKAAVAQAQLDLGYTNITSPVDGVIGTTQTKVGSLVSRGVTLLNIVSQLNPILFRCAVVQLKFELLDGLTVGTGAATALGTVRLRTREEDERTSRATPVEHFQPDGRIDRDELHLMG